MSLAIYHRFLLGEASRAGEAARNVGVHALAEPGFATDGAKGMETQGFHLNRRPRTG